jgi:predicted aspartyl protease/Flp pilus assembly protein TadD
MKFSSQSPSTFIPHSSSFKRVAVGSLAAFCVCLALCVVGTPDVAYADEKARSRAERALREGDFQLAEKLFREILAKDGRDHDARLSLSYALLKQRNLQDAFDHAARVVAVEPLSARAHALLGMVVLSAGDFRLSVEEFRTALSIKDNEPVAVAGLAMVDFYENRLNECMVGLRRAMFLDPKEPDYVYSFAVAASRNERYKEAANAYERFLEIAPRTDEERRARINGLIRFLRYLGGKRSLYEPDGASRVAISFDAPDDRPIIQVRINGREEPLRFVIDTGSGMSVISDETAKRLGLDVVARGGQARAVGGGGRFEIVYGFLDSVEIGEARVRNVPVYIRKFYDEKYPADGYIGLSVLTKFLTTIDYGSRTFTLNRERIRDHRYLDQWRSIYRASNTRAVPNESLAGIPLRSTASGFLSSEVFVNQTERPFNFIVDTGASISVIAEKVMTDDDITRFKQNVKMRIYGAAGVAEGVKMLVLPRVVVGQHTRERIAVAVLDLDPINETTGFIQSGILGGNFLRHFRVTFDFQNSVVLFEPLRPTKSPSELPKSGNAGTIQP